MSRKTLVLRFRDINVNKGETIQEHLRVIGDHGYCWWGWLFRQYEDNPYKELKSLHEDSSSLGSYEILLYDTGLGKLFSADCEQIFTAPQPIRSPEIDMTPNYYRDRKAPAWFRLLSIAEVDDDVVEGRTCIAMPSANDECFTDFLGSRIARKEDLRRQEVTLWVLE